MISQLNIKSVISLSIIFLISSFCIVFSNEENKPNELVGFLDRINIKQYKSTSEPVNTPIFKWDFSQKGLTFVYNFKQEAINDVQMHFSDKDKPSPIVQKMTADGLLLIKSNGDHTSDLVLKNLKINMKSILHEGMAPTKMVQTAPPMVLQGVKEDSSGSFGDSSQDILLKMLFPLPGKHIEVGDFYDMPMEIPFNAMGSSLIVKGRSRITVNALCNDWKSKMCSI